MSGCQDDGLRQLEVDSEEITWGAGVRRRAVYIVPS